MSNRTLRSSLAFSRCTLAVLLTCSCATTGGTTASSIYPTSQLGGGRQLLIDIVDWSATPEAAQTVLVKSGYQAQRQDKLVKGECQHKAVDDGLGTKEEVTFAFEADHLFRVTRLWSPGVAEDSSLTVPRQFQAMTEGYTQRLGKPDDDRAHTLHLEPGDIHSGKAVWNAKDASGVTVKLSIFAVGEMAMYYEELFKGPIKD
jgi:hypothetical protein